MSGRPAQRGGSTCNSSQKRIYERNPTMVILSIKKIPPLRWEITVVEFTKNPLKNWTETRNLVKVR